MSEIPAEALDNEPAEDPPAKIDDRPPTEPIHPEWHPRWPLPYQENSQNTYLTLIDEYERRTSLFSGWRDQLIKILNPGKGDTVVDVGCGAGSNFAALRSAVGPHGTIIGVEESPDLIAVAAERVTRIGWTNIELINSAASTVNLSARADAALFCAVPDVLRSRQALGNILSQLRHGGGVAAGGWQHPVRLAGPVRAVIEVCQRSLRPAGQRGDPPWRLLAEMVDDLEVQSLAFGAAYLAHRAALRTDHRREGE